MQHITNDIGNVTSSQCWQFLQDKKVDSYLIDVRAKEEWEETGIADLRSIDQEVKLISFMFFAPSVHINQHFIEDLRKEIPNHDANLFFICKSGGRSAKAAALAMQNGYKRCYNVEDGFSGNMYNEDASSLNANGWVNSNLARKAL